MSTSTYNHLIFPGKITLPEVKLPEVLPASNAALRELLVAQHEAYLAAFKSLEAQVNDYFNHLVEQFILSRHRVFSASSEVLSTQGRLFDEAESLATDHIEEFDTTPDVAVESTVKSEPTPKARGKRAPLPQELPRVDIIHDLPEAERTCPNGTLKVVIGEEVSEQLDIVPMQIRVLRHIRKTYACQCDGHSPVTADLPPQPLPKSNASPNFLATMLINKYVDGLPLTRFSKVLARHDVYVPPQTLARWTIKTTVQVLQPLFNVMRDYLFDGIYIHIDETVVQVLKEEDKAPTSNSYMWVSVGGPPDKPVIIYEYDPSRSGQVPVRLLEGYQGYLMTDGYEGYSQLIRTGGITHIMCWAHTRRKFMEAKLVQPKGKKGLADEAVTLIGKLYKIEREYKDKTDAERLLARQQFSVPVLDKLHAWLTKNQPTVNPKCLLGKAMAYMHNHWDKLTPFTERGDLPVDNNRCENAIRPFVVGRKGWLFSDTPAGAKASAMIYSMVETAKASGVEPYNWFCHILRELPSADTLEKIETLLPWNYKNTDLAA